MMRPSVLRLPVLAVLCLTCRVSLGATPAQYDAALAQVQAALSEEAQSLATSGSSVVSPSGVAARVLSPVTQVDRPGLAPQPVDNSLLLRTITRVEATPRRERRIAQLRAAAEQVSVLRHEVAVEAPSSALAGEAAAQAARAVLSENVYGYDPLPPPGLLDRFVDWLSRTLSRLFRRPGPHVDAPDINPVFIKALLIALLAGAFAVLVGVLVQVIRRRGPRTQPLALDETEAALVQARDTDSLRALAEQKARQGDYRLALRFLYLALLVALDTGGVLRFDRSKTNWEYLRALRAEGRDDVYQAITPLTREFDRVWYGFAHADADDYARALAQYEALTAAAKTPLQARPSAA